MLTMIELYIYKRNAHNDWSVHLYADNDWKKCWQWLNWFECTMIDLYIYDEMLTMIELYIYKRNAHNDWSVHL